MKKATLNYVIATLDKTYTLPLETSPLYYIDNFTSQYKSDDELVENYPDKKRIEDFINRVGKKGKIKITYVLDLSKKETLPPLYNSEDEIILDDDPLNNRISELEKARKLLFNSNQQLYAKMLSCCTSMEGSFSYKISLSYPEYLFALKHGLEVEKQNGKAYVNFKELVKYRAKNKKLLALRPLYEDMLEIWKKNILSLYDDEVYYYSRQLRILYNNYATIKSKRVSVSNLQVSKTLQEF